MNPRLQARDGAAIPILVYHNIAERPPGVASYAGYVSPARFARQMSVLRALGIQGLSMAEAVPYLRGERRGRVAVVTFDDGYVDTIEAALPVLLRYGHRATCFVVSGEIGRYNAWDADALGVRKPLMNADQIRTWLDAGMELGAHSRTHPHLSRCSPGTIRDEVAGSRADLENRFGVRVAHFAYPYGDYDDKVIEAVIGAGYVAATTIARGRARAGSGMYELPRVSTKGSLAKVALRILTPIGDKRL